MMHQSSSKATPTQQPSHLPPNWETDLHHNVCLLDPYKSIATEKDEFQEIYPERMLAPTPQILNFKSFLSN